MEKVLFLSAPLVERIWGGSYFKDNLHLTDNDSIGEMWSVSSLKECSSIILNGKYKGMTLYNLFNEHKDLFNIKDTQFPILIKLIATKDDLSVQVHPDDKYARLVENKLGKTEGWLILDSNESSIVVGHNAKNKDELVSYIKNNDYEHLLNRRIVKRGEFYPILPGTIHAIGKNIVLLEVQQSSDVTYRFYDYNRKDKNGNTRELHLNKALDVTSYEEYDNNILNVFESSSNLVWDNKYFNVIYEDINDSYIIKKDSNYLIVTVIEGTIRVNDRTINFGKSFILTSYCNEIEIKGKGKIVITKSK